MQKVKFRFSDNDLSAYLMMRGYKPIHIEVVNDKKHYNKKKAFVYFEGDKEQFINIQLLYRQNKLNVNPKEFSKYYKHISKLIKKKMLKKEEGDMQNSQ